MKLPAVEPYDVCQTCKAEMLALAAVATGLWWCPKCGTLATVADQWVPKDWTPVLASISTEITTLQELPEGPK